MAPEIIIKEPYHPYKTDAWAMGVVLFYIVTGKHPFSGKDQNLLFNQIQNTELTFDQNITDPLRHLLTGLLKKRPEERSSVQDILNSKWLIN
jgi:serine/threonine protein kinase